MKTLEDLMQVIEWSHPVQLNTKRGPRIMRKAPIEKEFWDIYTPQRDEFKPALNEAGIQIGKWREQWQLSWWSDENGRFRSPVSNVSGQITQEPEMDLEPLRDDSILFQFQKTSVQLGVRSMKLYNRVLLGHSTGVGKTFCALGIARELGKRVAVICPLAIRSDWFRAAKTMGVEPYEVVGYERCKTGKSKIGKWTDNQKREFRFELPDDCILIFDELHRCKGEATQNAFLARDSVIQNIPSIGLSATIADDPTKLWAIGQFLGLHNGGKDYYRFLAHHGCRKTQWGMKFVGGQAHLKRLHHRIYPDRGNRLRHSDLGDEFPETIIAARAFDMDNARAIASEYDDLQLRIEELRQCENFAANVLAEQTRARQRIELHKSPAVVSLVKDLLEEDASVFIAVSFRETMEFLKKELKTDCAIYGGQSEMERRGYIDSFQRDKQRVIIGITQAVREGISLHDVNGNHHRVALIYPQPSVYDLKQVLGRVHRAGGKSRSCQYVIYAAGVPIEERTCNALDAKLKRMDILNDGDCDPTISLSVQHTKKV
jgi:superfamily II DNA or RNA helicase